MSSLIFCNICSLFPMYLLLHYILAIYVPVNDHFYFWSSNKIELTLHNETNQTGIQVLCNNRMVIKWIWSEDRVVTACVRSPSS